MKLTQRDRWKSTTSENGVKIDRFNSLSDFIESITHEYGSPRDTEFYGPSLAFCKQLAMHGWSDGCEKVKKFKSRLENIVARSIEVPEIFFDNTGLDFDMGLVMTGQPECWYDYSPKEPIKVVRIAYGIGVSGGMSDDMMALRGGAIAALIALLETHSVRVELDVFFDFNIEGKDSITWVRAKDAGQPMDTDRLAFLLMHKGMARRLAFGWTYQTVEAQYDSGCVGWCSVQPDLTDYDLAISRGYIGWSKYQSTTATVQWIKEQLAKFGVNIELVG